MAGRIKEAESLAVLAFTGTPESQRHYQPLGDLFLAYGDHEGEVEDYRRELDLQDASITVSYRLNGVSYKRRIFSSAVDQVIVMHLSADQPGKLSITAHFERERWLMPSCLHRTASP
jgi:alpha-L-fucosidase 2